MTHFEVLLGFFSSKSTRVSQQVAEAHGNASINIENKGILLGRGDLFNSEGIIEERVVGEMLLGVGLDELNAQIGVGLALNLWGEKKILENVLKKR